MSLTYELFTLSAPLLELVVRGTVMYWFLFLVFRVFARRDNGSLAIADIVVLVVIASAARNGLAGDYYTVLDGMVTIGTIVGWNVVVDWAAFHSRTLERWLEPPKLLLVRNGRIQHRNLRREFMTEEQLKSKLREHGIERTADVRRAWLESSGSVTVIKRRG
jgi:uncharacterized membrane protein YcaP (DUF421 family)